MRSVLFGQEKRKRKSFARLKIWETFIPLQEQVPHECKFGQLADSSKTRWKQNWQWHDRIKSGRVNGEKTFCWKERQDQRSDDRIKFLHGMPGSEARPFARGSHQSDGRHTITRRARTKHHKTGPNLGLYDPRFALHQRSHQVHRHYTRARARDSKGSRISRYLDASTSLFLPSFLPKCQLV